jgi:late competence protein required for DNA uptake (superfamily II DNA/RNA helicase)
MRSKRCIRDEAEIKVPRCAEFFCGFCCQVGRIVNYVTKVAAKSADKKAIEIGILINASSLTALCNS